jgi:hypothetical protein
MWCARRSRRTGRRIRRGRGFEGKVRIADPDIALSMPCQIACCRPPLCCRHCVKGLHTKPQPSIMAFSLTIVVSSRVNRSSGNADKSKRNRNANRL